MARAAHDWRLLGVPIDSVGSSGGTELAPAALRDAGLGAGLEDLGDLESRIRDTVRDPGSGVIALADVLAVTREVRSAVARHARAGRPLLVLGGCCTLVPGLLGGLRDAGFGGDLIYLDGHLDLYDGATSPTGEAADMPVAVALGTGPDEWVAAAGGPTVRPQQLALVGPRDADEARGLGSLMPDRLEGVEFADIAAVRAAGPAALGARLAEARERGYWVHLDVDVLDQDALPATDYLSPGGLGWDELADLLGPLVSGPRCAGLNVTCLNPEKDPAGASTARLAALVGDAIAGDDQGARGHANRG